MTAQILTQERLKELLNYNPETGHFTWIKRPSRYAPICTGNKAGNLQRTGYIRIQIDGIGYLSHRLSFLYMKGLLPSNQVDHINHIKNDNRWLNLRHATNIENHRNLSISKNNTSGAVGVSLYSSRNGWYACIKIDGKTKHLGSFKEKWNAICARKSAEYKHGFHENHGT